jgi:two-component system nitrate/nitrite response regulator NarL
MEQAPIRLLIVEDHAMVASALAAALGLESDVEVVGIAHSVAELGDAIEWFARGGEHIDVALVDYHLADGTGIDVARLMSYHCPGTRVVMMSGRGAQLELRAAIEAGCVGFLNKSSELADLVRVVRCAARGEASFDAAALHLALMAPEARPESPDSLSHREQEVLSMLAAGLTTEVMASQLYLSQHTVRNHVRNLTAKLGAHSRLEAVSLASRAGLITMVSTVDA